MQYHQKVLSQNQNVFPKSLLGTKNIKNQKNSSFLSYNVVTYLALVQSNYIQMKNCIYTPTQAPLKILNFFW